MPNHPHLVIIMADQLRFDMFGSHTPNLYQLKAESTNFTRAYCNSPLCVPARGAFFTGHYPNGTGCRINPWDPNEREFGEVKTGIKNLYQMMEDEWDSWQTGKQHFFTQENIHESPESKTKWLSLEVGYDDFLKENQVRKPGGDAFRAIMPEMTAGKFSRLKKYSIPTTGCYEEGMEFFFDEYITQKTLQAIRERDRDKPILLNAMFLAPHPPLDIPEPFYSAVDEIDLPENVGLWSGGQSPLQMYNLTGFLGGRYSRKDWQETWRVYAGLVSLLDDCVGRIVQALKDEGIYDDAYIIFTSDHGEMLGSHCLWQKMCMYEESTHVNLMVKSPRGKPFVAQSDQLISHIDILPTLCDLLGLETPVNLPGRSLKETIESGKVVEEKDVFIQFDGNGARGNFQRCLIRGNNKLIVDVFKDEVFFELYDLQTDPQEKYNLAFDSPEVVAELFDALVKIMHETIDEVQLDASALNMFLGSYRFLQNSKPEYPNDPGFVYSKKEEY